MKKFISATVAFILLCISAGAAVRLPHIIGNGMVLQRNSDVRLWGWAGAGKNVRVRTSWNNARYSVKAGSDGFWELTVRTGDAGGPYEITLSDGEEMKLTGVLLGEVWICSGQSNMEMPVCGFSNQPVKRCGDILTEAAAPSDIRLFLVKKQASDTPEDDCGGCWKKADPAAVSEFSAVGYLYAKILSAALDGVPVGMVGPYWGGSCIEAWMSRESILATPGIDHDIALQGKKEPLAAEKFFNGMIWPIHRYTAKGFLWYQGCSNYHNWFDYRNLMVSMVSLWRSVWGDHEMPFYYVQIAPFGGGPGHVDGCDYSMVVEAQLQALGLIPHSGMAATTDLGERDNIHISDKAAVAKRLAWLALANDYGIDGLPKPAPVFSRFERDAGNPGQLLLHFDNLCPERSWYLPDSFVVFRDGRRFSPEGFELAGVDRVWHKATASMRLESNIIRVESPDVPYPVAVRYGFHNYLDYPVLVTTSGQPLVPFRTDDWPVAGLSHPRPDRSFSVSSPSGNNVVSVTALGDGFHISADCSGERVIEAGGISLNLSENGKWDGTSGFIGSEISTFRGTLHTAVRVKSEILNNDYNLLRINYDDYSFELRAYDEGFAYRFVGKKDAEDAVTSESLEYEFAPSSMSYTQLTDKLQNWFEYNYTELPLSGLPSDKFSLMPVLVRSGKSRVILSEADLYGYAGSYLRPTGHGFELLGVNFPSKEELTDWGNKIYAVERENYIVRTGLKRNFPWRVVGIYDSDAELLGSELIAKVSEGSGLDWSWIRPGKALWDWWNHNNITGVDFKAGINTATYLYMIDWAAEHGLEYVLIDEGWSSRDNLLVLNPDVDMPEICRHARERGVGVCLWAKWINVDKQLDEAFGLMSSWGVKGVKIDFMDRNDAKMTAFYERVLRKAADCRMLVDFHGSYPPDGMRMKYPNLMTCEGVLGLENDKWHRTCTPHHQLMIPFIRQWAGPMDFTPGAMLNAQPESFIPCDNEPMGQGTRCHHLAMYVAYESPLQMVSDSPSKYDRWPESFSFIRSVPTVWDETRPLFGTAGECLGIARRSGERWFIGVMCAGDSRNIDLPLDFLGGGEYTMTLHSDGANADTDAMDSSVSTSVVTAGDTLRLHIARNGGAVAEFKKK